MYTPRGKYYTLWGIKDKYHTGIQKFPICSQFTSLHTNLWITKLTQAKCILRTVPLMVQWITSQLPKKVFTFLQRKLDWSFWTFRNNTSSSWFAQPKKSSPKCLSLNCCCNSKKWPLEKTSPSQQPTWEDRTRPHTLTFPYRFLHPDIIPFPVQLAPTPTVPFSHGLEE